MPAIGSWLAEGTWAAAPAELPASSSTAMTTTRTNLSNTRPPGRLPIARLDAAERLPGGDRSHITRLLATALRRPRPATWIRGCGTLQGCYGRTDELSMTGTRKMAELLPGDDVHYDPSKPKR